MNFDKDERVIDRQYNNHKNYKSERKWLLEEIKQNNKSMQHNIKERDKLRQRITFLKTRLFFKEINLYNHYLLEVVIEEEFDNSFKEMDAE